MFGYIKPVPAELKVREYELYKSVYCGLCASLGRNTTCLSKLTLSYDFVFLALFRMALAGESGRMKKRRCITHPSKKRPVLTESKELDYCARVSALLIFWKLRDDIKDERGVKRLSARFLIPIAGSMRKKALRSGSDLVDLDKLIADKLCELSNLEGEKIYSPDAASEPFGELMAAVCSTGFSESNARIAAEVGRHVGRFIYILDAADDLAADLEHGRYNPFRLEGKTNAEILAAFDSRKAALTNSLTMELTGIERAIALIGEELPEYLEIIRNIIYLGLPARVASTIGSLEDNMEN